MYHGFSLAGGMQQRDKANTETYLPSSDLQPEGIWRKSGNSNPHDCVRHNVVLTKEEADRLDLSNNELAQRLINAVRMERGGLVKMCLPPPPLALPQSYYLISALKQANQDDQHKEGVLGGLSNGDER